MCSEWNANLDATLSNFKSQKFDEDAKDDARHYSSNMYKFENHNVQNLLSVNLSWCSDRHVLFKHCTWYCELCRAITLIPLEFEWWSVRRDRIKRLKDQLHMPVVQRAFSLLQVQELVCLSLFEPYFRGFQNVEIEAEDTNNARALEVTTVNRVEKKLRNWCCISSQLSPPERIRRNNARISFRYRVNATRKAMRELRRRPL